jgi:hypothetical protein
MPISWQLTALRRGSVHTRNMHSKLDAQEYDDETLNVFEILASYFVNIFYNALYEEAEKYRLKNKVHSLTEGYKMALRMYNDSLDNPSTYIQVITSLVEYFNEWWDSGSILSYGSCVDIMIQPFIPEDYFNSMNLSQKQVILREVISSSVKRIIVQIVEEHISSIIDNHQESDNINVIRNDLIQCFILEKEKMYKRFIYSETTNGQITNAKLNIIMVNDVKTHIKQLVDEKCSLNRQLQHITGVKNACLQRIHKHMDVEKELRKEIEELKGKNKVLRESLKAYENANDTTFGMSYGPSEDVVDAEEPELETRSTFTYETL